MAGTDPGWWIGWLVTHNGQLHDFQPNVLPDSISGLQIFKKFLGRAHRPLSKSILYMLSKQCKLGQHSVNPTLNSAAVVMLMI